MLAEIYAGFNDVAKTTMEDDKKVTLKVVLPTKKVSWGFIHHSAATSCPFSYFFPQFETYFLFGFSYISLTDISTSNDQKIFVVGPSVTQPPPSALSHLNSKKSEQCGSARNFLPQIIFLISVWITFFICTNQIFTCLVQLFL